MWILNNGLGLVIWKSWDTRSKVKEIFVVNNGFQFFLDFLFWVFKISCGVPVFEFQHDR